MKLSLPDRTTRLALVAAVAFLGGGCVKPDAPSVGIKSLAADIVFGATPIEEEETQPTAFEPAAPATDELDELPPQLFEPAPPKSFPRPPFEAPKPAAAVCREAALDEFPDEVAPLNVPAGRLPKEGIYRWKKSGTQTLSSGAVVQVGGFEERAIRNVAVIESPVDEPRNALNEAAPAQVAAQVGEAGMHFSFEMLQPFGDGVAITKYLVNTNAVSREANATLGEARASGGDPERGVVIESVTYADKAGTQVGNPFVPVNGLLVAPLPIRTGEQFQSVAVDPRTQQAWSYDAQLVKRDRVDACGEIVDGWLSQGTLTVTGSEAGERAYDLIVAPQLGGVPISEHVKGVDENGTTYDITYSLGQLEPSPFPTAGG